MILIYRNTMKFEDDLAWWQKEELRLLGKKT